MNVETQILCFSWTEHLLQYLWIRYAENIKFSFLERTSSIYFQNCRLHLDTFQYTLCIHNLTTYLSNEKFRMIYHPCFLSWSIIFLVSSVLPPLSLSMKTYKALPLNLLSRLWGLAASAHLPRPVNTASVWCFASLVGCDRLVLQFIRPRTYVPLNFPLLHMNCSLCAHFIPITP